MKNKDENKEADTQVKNLFTYVGGGEDSPRVINFMGRVKFTRGKAVEVTDEVVLRKITGHPCFVVGAVEEEDLHNYDEEAKEEADKRRALDKATDAAYKKKHKTE